LSYSCFKMCFLKTSKFQMENKDIVGIHRMGLEERMLLIMLSYTLLSVSIFYLKLFWLQKAWCKTPKFKWKMKIWRVSKERVLIMFSNTFSMCTVLDFSSFISCCQNSKFK
jgi:hypothetical protein